MAIIYSYPLNFNILDTDIVVGTSTKLVGGKKKNFTKSFSMLDIYGYIASNLDIQAPNLQEVTTTGNITTLDIQVNGLTIGRGNGSISGNTAIGDNALKNSLTGNSNTAGGFYSLFSNTNGNGNSVWGYNASFYNTIGNKNVSIGTQSLLFNTTGSNNIAIGSEAGKFLTNKTSDATILNNSVMLGCLTSPLGDNQSNQIVIGYNATGLGSNTTTIGNASITTTRLRGAVLGGSFVKDGGTSLQYLMADGSVSTGDTIIPTLQEVTTVGATTNRPIVVSPLTGTTAITGNSILGGTGLRGNTAYGWGVFGYGSDNGAWGVRGWADGAASYGVRGQSINGIGTAGFSDNNIGIFGYSTSGKAGIFNIPTSNTSNIVEFQKNGVNQTSISHNGNVTANAIIKLGGLSTQFLMADGSVTTAVTPTIPTLQQVTTAGETTNVGIKVIGLEKYISVTSQDNETGAVTISTDVDGLPYIQLGLTSNENTAIFRADDINTNSVYQLPNQSGVMALTSDINNRLVVEKTTGHTLTNADSGGIIIFKTTAAQTLNIPLGLDAGFECTFVTLAGITLTVPSVVGITLNNATGTTMAGGLSFTLKRMLATDTFIVTGNL